MAMLPEGVPISALFGPGRSGFSSGPWSDRSFYDLIFPDPPERWPQTVEYSGRSGSNAVFVDRDHFWMGNRSKPSACTWIVPGSTP